MQAQLSTPPTFGDPRLPDRFWAKVNPNGPVPAQRPDLGPCWQWTGACGGDGYGVFRIGSHTDGSRRMIAAHRFAYMALVGPIPEGLESDHLCRNHPCIKPAHIELVTSSVNSLRGITGTLLKGEAIGSAKLKEEQVLEIRSLQGTVSQRRLATRFGISQSQIGRIQRGQDWAHCAARSWPQVGQRFEPSA